MSWREIHDEMLCREVLVVDPFTGTKRGTVGRGAKWEQVAENLNKIQLVYFKVDKRAVRDRYNLLSKELRNKLKNEERASGIETEMTDVEVALEEIIEKEDAAEREVKIVDNQKKMKDSIEKENAENIRNKAMERLGQTQKRKADEAESAGRKKRRSSGSDTVNFLREKNEQVQLMHKEEMELRRQELDVESKKQDNFMQMMLTQQQIQQKQMQEFQVMVGHQAKQQNDLMLALVSKLIEKK